MEQMERMVKTSASCSRRRRKIFKKKQKQEEKKQEEDGEAIKISSKDREEKHTGEQSNSTQSNSVNQIRPSRTMTRVGRLDLDIRKSRSPGKKQKRKDAHPYGPCVRGLPLPYHGVGEVTRARPAPFRGVRDK